MTVSSIIQDCLPVNSYLYRMGGDEFSILFTETDMESCKNTIDVIRKKLEPTGYTCAIGIAEWSRSESFQAVYNLADQRMYEDKRLGKETGI